MIEKREPNVCKLFRQDESEVKIKHQSEDQKVHVSSPRFAKIECAPSIAVSTLDNRMRER